MIVSIYHQKGGVGKTTVAVNLATVLGETLVDLDMQQSCYLWSRIRERSGCPAVQVVRSVDEQTVQADLASLRDSTVVVDHGGFDSLKNRAALAMADLVISPVRPSQLEVFGLQQLEHILMEVGKRSHVLITCALPQSKGRVRDLASYVQTRSGVYSCLSSVIRYRIPYQTAYAEGAAVTESEPGSPAAAEMEGLAKEITAILEQKEISHG